MTCALAVVSFWGCATSPAPTEPAHRAPPPVVAAEETGEAPAHEGPALAPKTDDDKGGVHEAAPDEPAARSARDPFGDVGFHEVDQKTWLAGLREKIAQQEKIDAPELRVSPGLLRVAYVKSPAPAVVKPGARAPKRRHEIVVVDNQGRPVARFRAVAARTGDEPPKDLQFLAEDRLVYEVVEPPPDAATTKPAPHSKAKHAAKGVPRRKPKAVASKIVAAKPAAPPPPTRTFVIQPLTARAAPVKCVGVHFVFSRGRDHLAYVAGTADRGFVAVDGAQIYPRRGKRTVVASPPAWSRDGRSLALLETPGAGASRLVLLAAIDNPTGDTTWDLPPETSLDGAAVFWAGADKLVVGKTPTRPIFSSSFTTER